MSMVINTNTSAMNTATLLSQSSNQLSKALQELSSGSSITSPADNSAGLAVSMNLVAQEDDNTAASNNIADAVSFNQTQDGYLTLQTLLGARALPRTFHHLTHCRSPSAVYRASARQFR